MAVTLYRCQKCRGLFNAVFEPNKWCRDCKFQQAGYQPQGGESMQDQVRIVDAGEESVGGGKQGVSGAIGGPIGDAQGLYDQQANALQMNALSQANLQNLLGSSNQGVFSGGYETRSPFEYRTPGYYFKFSGFMGEDRMRSEVPVPVKEVPESSPHDAILKPSRKLKLAAE